MAIGGRLGDDGGEMNETLTPITPRLERPRDDRVIAGVASGLARRLGVGTGWVRVAFVVLSFFGGLGLLLYVVGWLAIREEGSSTAVAEQWIGDLEGSTAWIGVGLIILAGMVLLGATQLVRIDLVLAGGLFLAGLLLYRGRIGPDRSGGVSPQQTQLDLSSGPPIATDDAAQTPAATERAAPEPLPPVVVADGAAFGATPEPAPASISEPRPPSYLGRIVVASGLIVIGMLAMLDNLDVVDPGARHYVAAAVLVVGLGLLVGSVFGRGRGLIALGLLLIPPLLVTAAVRVPLSGEWGDRFYAPTDASEVRTTYELSGGQLSVDLRGIATGSVEQPITIDLGVGEALVWLPETLDVEVHADVGMGALELLGEETGGFGVDDSLIIANGDGVIDMVIRAEVGIGALRINGSPGQGG